VLIAIARGQTLNPLWHQARLMLVVDHINLLGSNPLVGPNPDALGARFPDMSEVYDAPLRYLAEESALTRGIQFVRGVYIARAARNTTEAETRLLRLLGGDATGEGMVPEAIVAVHGGMRVLGLVHLEPAHAVSSTGEMPSNDAAIADIIADVVAQI
jgi:purine-nucleoside phosphorylase